MNREHLQEPVRLTPEQRDRVLDLAARLQAQHDGTIAVGDLAQAASEAGIDARFVHEAARAVTHQAPPVPRPIPQADRTVACALLGMLTLINFLAILTPFGRIADSVAGIWLLLLAAVAGRWSVKGRLPFWLVPATILMTLLGAATLYEAFHFRPEVGHGSFPVVLLIEALFALLAALITMAVTHYRSLRASAPR